MKKAMVVLGVTVEPDSHRGQIGAVCFVMIVSFED